MITLEEIYQELAAEFQARTGKTAGSNELAVRFYAVAAQIYSLYVQGEWTRRQCFPQTATGENLDMHAQLRGIARRQAASATGTVRFYVDGSQDTGIEIPEGTVCMTAAGVRFLTTRAVTVAARAEYADAPVTADEAGAAGNVGANTIVFMALPPVRVTACANLEALTNGLEEEGDEELRARVLATYQRLANGANNAFYRQAAKATGTVRFYVSQPQETGTEIAKGTVCMTAAGVRFLTTRAVTVAAQAEHADAPVIASEAGAAGNVGANTIVFMALPPVRVVACANPEPLVNGMDEEGDEELRARVLAT